MSRTPFTEALGSSMEQLPPLLVAHFGMPRSQSYRGHLRRVWHRQGLAGRLLHPVLWLMSLSDTIFPETGENIPFELHNEVSLNADGSTVMLWRRTFHFQQRSRRFTAVMVYDRSRGCIVDRLGRGGLLEVELYPEVHDEAIRILSGPQWLRLGTVRLRLPDWMIGSARIRERVDESGAFAVEMHVENQLVGPIFGYEGTFLATDHSDEDEPTDFEGSVTAVEDAR